MKKYSMPLKPMKVNQKWGNLNIVNGTNIYAQFGFKLHNGTDYAPTKNKLISAPCDGMIVRTGNQPTGGGIFLGLIDGDGSMVFDFLHCEKLLVTEGQRVEEGQPLAIQDNTGYSTGEHTHIQPRPAKNWNGKFGADLKWENAVQNDANHSIDPETLWSAVYAEDIWAQKEKLKKQISLLQKLVELWQKLALAKKK
jgi:murein DD-endopeptidase MepM/ murein hydrolase activator NlpD